MSIPYTVHSVYIYNRSCYYPPYNIILSCVKCSKRFYTRHTVLPVCMHYTNCLSICASIHNLRGVESRQVGKTYPVPKLPLFNIILSCVACSVCVPVNRGTIRGERVRKILRAHTLLRAPPRSVLPALRSYPKHECADGQWHSNGASKADPAFEGGPGGLTIEKADHNVTLNFPSTLKFSRLSPINNTLCSCLPPNKVLHIH